MRIGLSKKNFIILVSLSFLFLVAGGYLLARGQEFSLLKSSRLGDSYEDFARLCSKERNGSDIICKAFIVDEKEVDDTVCFDLLVYDGVGSVEDMVLCDDPLSFDWDNPYEDYEKYVPVVIGMSIRKSFLGANKLKNAELVLMEDREMFNILDTLPEEQGRGSYFYSLIYIKEHQEIFDKGYYITSPIGTDARDHLVLYDAEVKEIFPQEGEVVLLLSTRIYGEELNLLISSKEFFFLSMDFGVWEEVLIDVDGINSFEKEGKFSVTFNFNPKELDVEEYLKSILESEEGEIVLKKEFNLIEIVAKEI